MAKTRIGAESSETRALIVEAAEQVIRDQGYAAASSRRVAAHAGLKPSLVHYYFPTTDDLLLAVFKRGAKQSDAMIEAALASDDPVRGLWQFFTDASRTALTIEFIALTNHRKDIRAKVAQHSAAMRLRQAEAIEAAIGDRLAALGCTPAALSLIMAGIGRALVMEAELTVHAGHSEARLFVEALLDRLLAQP